MTVESGYPGLSVVDAGDPRKVSNVVNRINSGFLNNVAFSKLNATAAPTVNDDIEDGYAPGSVWVDVTNDLIYQAVDVTAAAAVWLQPAMLSKANTFTAVQTIQVATAGDAFALRSTDAGSNSGPNVDNYRNSASPAAFDSLGRWVAYGNDSDGNKTAYGAWEFQAVDPTNGSEDGAFKLDLMHGSASEQHLYVNGSNGAWDVQFTDAGAGAGPTFRLVRVSASPAASDVMGSVSFRGRDSDNNSTDYAAIQAVIGDPANGAEDGIIQVLTLVSATAASRLNIGEGLYHDSATGGDKGDNTINFGAVYDDNVLLTDYVFDAALDGAVDPAKYNHAPAAAFDPAMLDMEAFEAHWRKRRALPGLPNMETWTEGNRPSIGALAQKAVEMIEVQAVHISKLNARLKKLESPTAGR